MKRYCAAFLTLPVLLSVPVFAHAGEALPSFPAITQALTTGESVSVVLDLSQCKGSEGSEPSKTRGGKRIDAYRITADGTLAFADDHFTLDREGKPIEQFLRYRVNPDGSAQFSMTVLSVPDYKPVGKTLSYDCAINKGLSFFAAK